MEDNHPYYTGMPETTERQFSAQTSSLVLFFCSTVQTAGIFTTSDGGYLLARLVLAKHADKIILLLLTGFFALTCYFITLRIAAALA